MHTANCAKQGTFDKDLDEIVSSKPFRRLSNKSQVMVKPTRDHFRSRLIHTIEVNHIAIEIGNQLELNVPFISAMAMGHDIGHTPFAHAGERAIREILRRELVATFNVQEKNLIDRNIFHHSSNSARILQNKYDSVQEATVSGVLTHSWAPWKEKDDIKNPIPDTYEGQVVAIADQIASINHDTEDIIEGKAYTNYDATKFSQELKKYIKGKKEIPDFLDVKLGSFLNVAEPGYGRSTRINMIVKDVTDSAKAIIKKNSVNSSTASKEYPIIPSPDWCLFLMYYEKFIREIIVQRESWFVGRDSIAEALVSTVFNHIWPKFKTGQDQQQSFFEEESSRKRVEEETLSIDHYKKFYNDEYGQKSLADSLKKKYSSITTWDNYIVSKIKDDIIRDKSAQILRLISIIDFVSGLTDRYCQEIFDRVYHEFSI